MTRADRQILIFAVAVTLGLWFGGGVGGAAGVVNPYTLDGRDPPTIGPGPRRRPADNYTSAGGDF
jgi:hypothetical protein